MSLRVMTNRPAQDTRRCPVIPQDLLAHLQLLFPDKAPSESERLSAIRHKAGQVSVVRYLTTQYEAQSKNILASPAT